VTAFRVVGRDASRHSFAVLRVANETVCGVRALFSM
jgi:hypothetical protein